MFIKEETIQQLSKQFGQPKDVSFEFKVSEKEYNGIKSSQKKGREHDVTLYIVKDKKIIVIAKHFYPQGLFRAPSGGINPGEDFVEGAKREAREETGCEIQFENFLLKTYVQFIQKNSDKIINWHSYIFQAKYISGNFEFTDTNEIREVALVDIKHFEKFSETMRASEIGGLHYRAALHDEVKKLIKL